MNYTNVLRVEQVIGEGNGEVVVKYEVMWRKAPIDNAAQEVVVEAKRK